MSFNYSFRWLLKCIALACICISMLGIGQVHAKKRKKLSLKKACKTEISKYCKKSRGKGIRRCLLKKAKKRSKMCKSALKRLKKKQTSKSASKKTKRPKVIRSRATVNPKVSAHRKPIKLIIPGKLKRPGKPKLVGKPVAHKTKALSLNIEILKNASKIPVRPYCWKGLSQYKNKCPDGAGIRTTGLSKVIELKSKSKTWTVAKDSYGNSYCSGVTYEAVAPVIVAKKWFEDKRFEDIVTFQQIWYVVCPEGIQKSSGLHCKHPDGSVYSLSKLKREAAVLAIEHAKIGDKIDYKKAQPGDIVQLYRSGWGHSVLFRSWIQSDGSASRSFNHKTVGLKYFSSQPATKGVGDHIECFKAATCVAACGSCELTEHAISVGRLTGP